MDRAFAALDDLGYPRVPQRLTWDVLDTFGKAFLQTFPSATKVASMIDSSREAVGYFMVNQADGLRVSSYNAFIDKTRVENPLTSSTVKVFEFDKGRLEVRTRCLVKRVLFDRHDSRPSAIGVEYYDEDGEGNVPDDSKTHRVYHQRDAGCGTILSAGSIGSPQILQCSGVGDFAHFATLSDPPPLIHELKGVGKNLQDHLQLRSVYRLNSTAVTLNTLANSLLGKIKIGLQ